MIGKLSINKKQRNVRIVLPNAHLPAPTGMVTKDREKDRMGEEAEEEEEEEDAEGISRKRPNQEKGREGN